MKRTLILAATAAVVVGWASARPATAVEIRARSGPAWGDRLTNAVGVGATVATPSLGIKRRVAYSQSQSYPWHGGYYDTAWGMPVAVVVPPTAESQAHLGWGVGATRVTPIQHQFERNYPGPGVYDRSWFQPTPAWPSSTDQLGDYYIRGPW